MPRKTLAALVVLVLLVLPGVARAQTGADYGRHVVMCAQEMGFDGEHNPGVMHRGFSGWPGCTCQHTD